MADLVDVDPTETREWVEALEAVVSLDGPERASELLGTVLADARRQGLKPAGDLTTPYVNTIPVELEPEFPGDLDIEHRLRSLIRWNAVAMVLRANAESSELGGHIASFQSTATLWEVGFNHFWHAPSAEHAGDLVYFQGHSSPGIYARAFLEGRLSEDNLDRFRRETGGGGLSSYPHPRLMPDFWEFPTVSMGLGPLAAVYQARFNRYLQNRGIRDTSQQRVWAFLGDGEMDEPESIAGISLAARERLDNLTFVINCNLQRLDGPVRGNGKIIQELEGLFRGAGWNVIKVVWGREWDELLARDVDGVLVEKMNTTVDGEFQKMSVSTTGAYVREHFFGPDPRLRKMVEHLSDDQLLKLRRGGHDYRKIFAAYLAATEFTGAPTVILAKTVKGWTLGRGVEARNITHQAKKLSEDELRVFRDRLELPIPDEQLKDAPYFHPGPDSEEVQYMLQRRQALGGPLPRRVVRSQPLPAIGDSVDKEFDAGSPTAVSTTMVFTRLLRNLIRDPQVGRRIVPIIPDEARTFGMDPLFKEVGIYASGGQHYDPVDSDLVLSYREAKDGQVLEEGITEAGSMASLQAAGTSYATHGEAMIPFYIFYSMFGFQRTGDQTWAFGDQRGRGFMIGATAGRTTLAGEGLQHDDGHSQVLASTVPVVRAYDPAYAYELAAIVRDGIARMYTDGEDVFYYVTVYNENYAQAPKPEGADEGIIKGIYRFAAAPDIKEPKGRVRLVGSGSILQQVIAARDVLAERGIAAEVYSATSFQQLRHEALQAERWNQLNPDKPARIPYVEQVLGQDGGPIVVATDWIRSLPDMVARWMKAPYLVLGTDGYGRSDTRENLRAWFGIDAPHIVAAAYTGLVQCGELEPKAAAKAIKELGVDPASTDPLTA
jgi:pyruvate dehydrogenase E1 component